MCYLCAICVLSVCYPRIELSSDSPCYLDSYLDSYFSRQCCAIAQWRRELLVSSLQRRDGGVSAVAVLVREEVLHVRSSVMRRKVHAAVAVCSRVASPQAAANCIVQPEPG